MKNTDAKTEIAQADLAPDTQVQQGTPLDVGFRYSEAARGALEQQGVNVPRREGLLTVGQVFAGVAGLTPVIALLGSRAEAQARTHKTAPRKPTAPAVTAATPQSLSEALQLIPLERLKEFKDPSRTYRTFQESLSVDLSPGSKAWRGLYESNSRTDSILVLLPRNDIPLPGDYAANAQYIHSAEILMRRNPTESFRPVTGQLIEGSNGNYAVQIMTSAAERASMEVKLNLIITLSNTNTSVLPDTHKRVAPLGIFKNDHDDFFAGKGTYFRYAASSVEKLKDEAYRNRFLAIAKQRDLIITEWPESGLSAEEKTLRLIHKIDEFTNPTMTFDSDICRILETGSGNCSALTGMLEALCALNEIPFSYSSGNIGTMPNKDGTGNFVSDGHSWGEVWAGARGAVTVDFTIKSNPLNPERPHYAALRGSRVSFLVGGFQSMNSQETSPFCIPLTNPVRVGQGLIASLEHTSSSYKLIDRF